MPTLSLCLIVKDEAQMLPGFLEAVRGIADEIVAIDTGSTDRSIELLRAAGARVDTMPWTGDFAAARNRSFDVARGDFALVLDPDERPAPDFGPSLRALLSRDDFGAATIRMRSLFEHGHHRDADLLRVLPLDPSVRFRHRIHEDASEDLAPWLERSKRRLHHLAPLVTHLGYTRARAADKDKKQRDGAALAQCIAEDPRDLYSHFKLLELARFWNDADMGQDAARSCQDVLLAAVRGRDSALLGVLERAPWGGELVLLLARALHPAQPARALAVVEALAGEQGKSAVLELGRGELLEELGRTAAARSAFSRCLALTTVPTAMVRSVRPHLGLARLAAADGALDRARQHVGLALNESPRDPEALFAAASFHGEGPEAFHAAHLNKYGPSVELDAATGEALLGRRRPTQAVEYLRRAAGDPPRGPLGERLALALILSGGATEALTLLGDRPEDPPTTVALRQVAALAAGVPPTLPPRPALTEEAEALATLLQQVAEGPNSTVTTRVLSAIPVLLPRHPWLAEVV